MIDFTYLSQPPKRYTFEQPIFENEIPADKPPIFLKATFTYKCMIPVYELTNIS